MGGISGLLGGRPQPSPLDAYLNDYQRLQYEAARNQSYAGALNASAAADFTQNPVLLLLGEA